MSAASGHDAAESGVSQGPSRIQAIRVLAAKTLRWGANKLDPPVPASSVLDGIYPNPTVTTAVNGTYRLTFLR